MHPAAWVVAICLAVLTSIAPIRAVTRSAEASAAPPPPASLVQADTLVGTVRGVYPDSGYIGVLTGTGFAIRLERVVVYETVAVEIEGAPSSLSELERGQIVRVVYRETVEGKVAQSIETLPLRREEGGA